VLPAQTVLHDSLMKILVVGISVRAIVESAVHSGYSVIALDAFGDQDLKALTESYALRRDFGASYSPHSLFEASRQIEFEAVAYTSNLENYPEIIELFAADQRLIGNLPQTVRAVRNWPDLFSRLEQAGFAVPKTIFSLNHRAPDSSRRWLVKPILSGGGHGIHFLQGRDFEPGRWMLQEYIPGKACSAAFVGNGREAILLGVTEQLIGMKPFGAQGFRYCGNILPLPEILDPETGMRILAQVRQTAGFLVREYGLTGVNGLDFIFDGSKIWLTEINPRYSASMELIERAYNLPVFQSHLESVASGRLPQFNLESKLMDGMFFGKSILFCEKDFVMPDAMDDQGFDLRDVPVSGEQLRKGSPICTLLNSQPTYADTLTDLSARTENLKERLYG
jgi:uncharacterized protein